MKKSLILLLVASFFLHGLTIGNKSSEASKATAKLAFFNLDNITIELLEHYKQ